LQELAAERVIAGAKSLNEVLDKLITQSWFSIHQQNKRYFSKLYRYLIPIPMCLYGPSGCLRMSPSSMGFSRGGIGGGGIAWAPWPLIRARGR
jgi:hypothetical protein